MTHHNPHNLHVGQQLVATKDRVFDYAGGPFHVFKKGDTMLIQGLVLHEGYMEVLVTKSLRSDWESMPASTIPEYFDIPASH